MHAEMMMILMLSLIVAQAILLIWRTKHPRSYQVGAVMLHILYYVLNLGSSGFLSKFERIAFVDDHLE